MESPSNVPTVTIQLPLYNEKYVGRRLIEAVCNMDYPKDKLEIQVLDDSDDDTVDLIESVVREYGLKGFDIVHIHRADRSGYKAGALKAGLRRAKGELIAIFDADFVPPAHFLNHVVKYFADSKIGFVQCKWGHINEDFSALTSAQALSLDLHFLVEQKAKSYTHIFMSFNGTAGIWRKSCIDDCGGWHASTLVEDMDLSYRAHMRGWKSLFLDDIVVDAELPVQMNAAKRQQFRWAKGSMQVAMKLLADVVFSRKVPFDTKLQSFFQMTRHIINPLFLAQFLIFPMLLAMDFKLYTESWAPLLVIASYIAVGPGGYLAVINRTWKSKWRRKAWQFFFLNFFAAGVTVNNSVAVFDAILGKKSEFLRTPKFGVVKKNDDWRHKEYVLPFTKTTLLEIFFAVYGIISLFIAIFSGNTIFAPLVAIPTIGFIYVAYLSVTHSAIRKKHRTRSHSDRSFEHPTPDSERNTVGSGISTSIVARTAGRDRAMGPHRGTSANHRILLAGVIAFLILGAGVAYYGFQSTIFPANKALGYIFRAQSAQTPEQLAEYVVLTKGHLRSEGNPIWLFPTVRTDFALIQSALDNMLLRAEAVESMTPHSEAYNMAMADLHESASAIEVNLMEALPYMYVSFENLVLAGVWVTAIIAVFAAMRKVNARTKARYQQQYKEVRGQLP
jgi:cellulose synthase/poly-beta-1,6-N-acetylglucosamine synthase-like glycosyltransferase